MKELLPAVPLTPEDYNIFMHGSHKVLTHEYAQLAHRLDRMSETQDRRDAALMYGAQRAPECAKIRFKDRTDIRVSIRVRQYSSLRAFDI